METFQDTQNQSTAHKKSSSNSNLLVITREFNVPVEQLFEAFTTPEALKIWWWPKDLFADRIDLDFREGGHYFINMKGVENKGGGMLGQFEEIVPNERIVMTDQFADEQGKVISAKEANAPGVWPEVIYITFNFESAYGDASRFTLSQEGIPNEMHKECTQGWSESFDKLEEYLNSRKN